MGLRRGSVHKHKTLALARYLGRKWLENTVHGGLLFVFDVRDTLINNRLIGGDHAFSWQSQAVFLRGIPGLALAVFTLVAIAAPAIVAAPESAAPRELVRSVKDAVAKRARGAEGSFRAKSKRRSQRLGSEKDTAVLVVASSALLRALLDAGAFAEARGLAQAILSGRKSGSQSKDSVSAAAINALGGRWTSKLATSKSAQSCFEAARPA